LLKNSPNGASCLDGTPPGYYYAPGSGKGMSSWYIHHMGGGWCTTMETCYDRSFQGLGSTNGYPDTYDLDDGYFSEDPAVNPLMATWNKSLFIYCDGSSFSGNNQTVTVYKNRPLYFRGFMNLNAYLTNLKETYPTFNTATDVVISGCSAGGLATFLHLDWWRDQFPSSTKVVGLQDSGFFLDYQAYGPALRWVFNQMNCSDGVNQKCIQHYQENSSSCIFAEHTSRYIETPIFHMQSKYDAWQVICILGKGDATSINQYGNLLRKKLLRSSLSNYKNGAFLDSCYHHCGCWDEISIKGQEVSKAFQTFYNTGYFREIDESQYPCDCCNCAWNIHSNNTIPDWCLA